MQTDKKNMLFAIAAALTFLLTGCLDSQRITPLPGTAKGQKNLSVAKRFQGTTQEGPTAVESAIELSEKYAELSDEAAVLRQKNQNLIAENSSIKEQLTHCRSQLKQTQKELNEANDLLIEMRIELNNWKADILGFRDEMRNADKAQLETLFRILKALGGEVKTESAQGESSRSRPEKTSITGEPNE